MAPYDVYALRRSEFPWADTFGDIYLNSASTGPLPERTRRAIHQFTEMAYRPSHELYDAHREIPARARRLCAQLIGARPEEIALGFNTTYGLNLAASALGLQPGDRVVLLDGDFPANVYPWLSLERRGVQVELLPRDKLGQPNEPALLERLARGDVRVLSVSWVSFCTGFRLNLDAISHECRRHGTYLVVDGIQALGAVPLDVSETPIDILATGAQKWLLSPQGAGFAYVRGALIESLDLAAVGWLGFKPSQDFGNLLDYAWDPLDDARRFELGSLAFSSVEAFNHSLSLLLELGIPCIEQHIYSVQAPLLEWIDSRPDVQLVSDVGAGRRSGIIAFRLEEPERAEDRMRAAGITVSVREGAIRTSTHVWNCREEILRLIEVLESVLDA